MYSRADSTSGNGLSRPKVDRGLHLVADGGGERVGLLGRERAVGDEPAAERRHGVALQRRLVLLGRSELLDRLVLGEMERHAGRGDDVAVSREAVHLRLDERRAVAGAGPRDRRGDRLVHLDRIAAVDRHARHAVGLRLDREILAVGAVRVLLLGARVDVVAVVLHHEDDRELPQRRDVQRLRERRPAWRRRRRRSTGRPGLACGSVPPRPRPRRAGSPPRRSPTCRESRSRRRSGASSRRCPCTGRPCGRRSRPSSPSGRCRAPADSRGSGTSRRTGRRGRASRSTRRSTPRRRRRGACGHGSHRDAPGTCA